MYTRNEDSHIGKMFNGVLITLELAASCKLILFIGGIYTSTQIDIPKTNRNGIKVINIAGQRESDISAGDGCRLVVKW